MASQADQIRKRAGELRSHVGKQPKDDQPLMLLGVALVECTLLLFDRIATAMEEDNRLSQEMLERDAADRARGHSAKG